MFREQAVYQTRSLFGNLDTNKIWGGFKTFRLRFGELRRRKRDYLSSNVEMSTDLGQRNAFPHCDRALARDRGCSCRESHAGNRLVMPIT